MQTPLGQVGIGNADNGLCGGMVFAALDYWHAGRTPQQQRPAPGSPLYKFIVTRLIDSWHVPAGVAQYYHWMTLPDGTPHGVSWLTIEQQWPQVKAGLDHGIPAALGVVTVASDNPAQLGENHQVLAVGYAISGPEVTVRVYDPNSGKKDGVHITFSTAAPGQPTRFAHNLNLARPVRGFFVTPYAPATPPS